MLNYILTIIFIIFGVLGWSMLIQSHAAWHRTLWKLNSTKGNIYSITFNRKTVENHPARDTNWEGPCHFSWLVTDWIRLVSPQEIQKSPRHRQINMAQRFPKVWSNSVIYGSGILSCLCILSNLCSETQLFINRPLAQRYTTHDVLYDLYATQSVWHQLPHGTTGVGRLSATWDTQGLIACWFQNNTFWTLSEVMPVSDFRLNMLDEYVWIMDESGKMM